MEVLKLNGLVIQVQPYEEGGWIATLYTEEMGLVSLYAAKSVVKGTGALTVFNLIEAVCNKGHGALWRCRECRITYGFLGLRKSLPALETAGELVQVIKESQMPERPSPLHYKLFIDYLKRLEAGASPWKVAVSFYLKILRLEGLWSDEPDSDVSLSEWTALVSLAYCRTGQQMEQVEGDRSLLDRVRKLFLERIA